MAGSALELVGLALRCLALLTVNNVPLHSCCQANLRTCRDIALLLVVACHQCRSAQYQASATPIFRQSEINLSERN